ncbi:MAG: hypoxanthine phosphoribosyltransferase [Chloroflexi bacterium]|jgi:hypoxanthine phosphoribosyltransferase|nr:hypoxanthine phosphoribosyltransferase [Chloroflexota bacterium]BCY18357.1 hypoxanthine phosphoribosyltransferase [Leptolinea sp. HRD-7]
MSSETNFPYDFIGKVLFTPEEIEKRVTFIGNQIHNEYRDSEKLLLLGLLRGSVVFMTDLMRKVQMPLTMDFMSVSSYSGSESSGFVRIDSDHKTNISGWDVILIDDIVDTGFTINTVRKLLLDRNPRSLKICALLDKVERHRIDVPIDYLGFAIPDVFVVGYGLDIDEKGRNLPYIASVDAKKYEKSKHK